MAPGPMTADPVAELTATLAGARRPPTEVDPARMTAERHERLQAEMERQGIEVAVLSHGPNVTYATGHPARGIDLTHALFARPVAVLVAGAPQPHLFGGDDGLAAVEAHAPLWPELDAGAATMAAELAAVAGTLAGRRVAVDEETGAMLRAGMLDRAGVLDATGLVAPCRLVKTADELACIDRAQRANEAAMVETRAALVPDATRGEVVGRFLARLAELGTEANCIDPIFQVMERRIADGPATTTGDVAFPTGVGDPTFATGDLVWVDTGVSHHGYVSDFGRTWVVGRDPGPQEMALARRWAEIVLAVLGAVAPGASAGDLCRAAESANDGATPWLAHFYLAHGLGTESAEMPLVGTDLGRDFDDGLTLAPGMVLVLEPVVWRDGVGGYRSEEVIAVTEDGWRHLGGGFDYGPFEG